MGQDNRSRYCLSAHTEGAKARGLNWVDTLEARSDNADDQYERAREGPIDDGLVVALNTRTNYANCLADTEIDSVVDGRPLRKERSK